MRFKIKVPKNTQFILFGKFPVTKNFDHKQPLGFAEVVGISADEIELELKDVEFAPGGFYDGDSFKLTEISIVQKFKMDVNGKDND